MHLNLHELKITALLINASLKDSLTWDNNSNNSNDLDVDTLKVYRQIVFKWFNPKILSK